MKTILTVFLFFSLGARAQSFVGTFVAVKGDVKILRTPGAADPGPFAQVEGVKYSYEDAKIGKKINPGELVQSGTDGKAKITYPNGDTFLVGSGTSLVMPTIEEKDAKKTSSAVKLIYGRLRSLISKKGPRSDMRVSTPDAVAGVRGTDFFVRSNPDVGTQLTVLRGEVGVQSADAQGAPAGDAVAVKSGYMVQVDRKKMAVVRATEATKEELSSLQIDSSIKTEKSELAPLVPAEKKEIADLNKKSKDILLEDIKAADPAMLKKLKNTKSMDDDDINAAVVAKLYQMAPAATKKKPTKEEMDSAGKGVYEKYYKKDPNH